MTRRMAAKAPVIHVLPEPKTEPLPEGLMEMLDAWDKLSGSVDRVVTALPFQMTEAMALLETDRREFGLKLTKAVKISLGMTT